MSGAERAEPLMEKTYVIQRRYLKSVPAPAIPMVKEEWPFLFSLRYFFTILSYEAQDSLHGCNIVSIKNVKCKSLSKSIEGTL